MPEIESPGDPTSLIAKLDAAARRGKLPGFAPAAGGTGTRFELADFGAPFESRLSGAAIDGITPGTARIRFDRPRLKPLLPWVFALILASTIWPGAWLTDSMLRSYSNWYASRPDWVTYAWYLPLTVPFCPMAMLSALRKSRASGAAEIPPLLDMVAAAVGGRVLVAPAQVAPAQVAPA